MSTLIAIPHSLNPETPFKENLSLINENFKNTLDYATAIQPLGSQFNGGTGSIPVSAGTTFNVPYGIYSPVPGSSVVAAVPSVSIYVDTLDSVFLFPDGTSLTLDQRKLRYSFTTHINDYIFDPNQGFPDASGTLYYLVSVATLQINNADSVDHLYYVTTNFKVLARKDSIFR